MNDFKQAIKKIGSKNLIAGVVLCLVCGSAYAIKKESIAEAVLPTLLGIVLMIGAAISLAMRTSRLQSKQKK